MIHCDKNSQPHGIKFSKMIPTGKLYEWLTLSPSPDVFFGSPGAQFSVGKNLIKCRTKKFYERALLSVSYSNEPIEAHCFERLWPSIFGLLPNFNHTNLDYLSGEKEIENTGITMSQYLKECVSNRGVVAIGELHSSYEKL